MEVPDVVEATARARHFIMRSRRDSRRSVRALNCGVSRHETARER
jgi:hypothetical protein